MSNLPTPALRYGQKVYGDRQWDFSFQRQEQS